MGATERPYDWRLEELARLGRQERQMAADLSATRRAVAELVKELLPQHASQSQIASVVSASGYSRTFVEAVRGGSALWSKD